MFEQLFHYPRVLARQVNGPWANERRRYLDYRAQQGTPRSTLLRWARELLVVDWSLASVVLHGKGRKDRRCPLWPKTVTVLRKLVGQGVPTDAESDLEMKAKALAKCQVKLNSSKGRSSPLGPIMAFLQTLLSFSRAEAQRAPRKTVIPFPPRPLRLGARITA